MVNVKKENLLNKYATKPTKFQSRKYYFHVQIYAQQNPTGKHQIATLLSKKVLS